MTAVRPAVAAVTDPFQPENLPEGGNTWDYIAVIEGIGNPDEAKEAVRRAAQALFDIGHGVKKSHITSRTKGVEYVRIEGRE